MQDSLNQPTRRERNEWRCSCGRLLFKGEFMVGIIEAKCPRCKKIIYLQEHNQYTALRRSFITIISLEGQILSVNSRVTSVLGYSEDEFIKTPLAELIYGSNTYLIKFWTKKLYKMRDSPKPHLAGFVRLIDKSGNKVRLDCCAKCIQLNGKWVIFAIVEENDQAFERLRVSRKKDKFAVHEKSDHFWDLIINSKGSIVGASEHGILKDHLGEFIGRQITDIFTPDTKPDIKDLQKDLAKEEILYYTCQLELPKCPRKSMEMTITIDYLCTEGERDFLVSFNPLNG